MATTRAVLKAILDLCWCCITIRSALTDVIKKFTNPR